MDAETTEPMAVAGYDFHDPAFITWWLNSLYLFPVEDQVAIAQMLRSALHAPGSRREIEAFIEFQASAIQGEGHSVDEKVALSQPDAVADLRGQLGSAWRRRPWLTAVGVLAGAYFVGKGAWFLQQFMRATG